MSGFVWFLAKKAWLSLFSADKDHSVSACQRRCFITHILSQQSWYLRVCVCVFRVINIWVKCLICKCDANAPKQSTLSHLEVEAEIIRESCHLSQGLSKPVSRAMTQKPLICAEKLNEFHAVSFSFFFLSSWGFCFLWKPRSPWQRLPDPVQETLPAWRVPNLCLLPRLRAHRRGCN